jgi:CBS domain-containing protein
MYRFLQCTAGQYMTREVRTVKPKLTLRELETLFSGHDFNAFPVVEGTRVIGLVTKFDFIKTFVFTTNEIVPKYEQLMSRTVGEVMTKDVVHVEPSAPLTRVLQLMVDRRARSFPVLDGERRLVGMISRQDIMRALYEATRG